MRRSIQGSLTVLGVVLAWRAAAEAKAILVTPAIIIDDHEAVTCVVTNFDAKPATVKVDILDDAARSLTIFSDGCNFSNPLEVGKTNPDRRAQDRFGERTGTL